MTSNQRFKNIRILKKLKVQEFADILQIPAQKIYDLEREKQKVALDEIIRICEKFNVVSDYIVLGFLPIFRDEKLDSDQVTPIILRSLKLRVEEYKKNIGHSSTAYVQYLYNYFQKSISFFDSVAVDEKVSSLEKITRAIEKVSINYPFHEGPHLLLTKEAEVKKRILLYFFQNLYEIELNYIINNPYQLSELIYSTISNSPLPDLLPSETI
jgi:transcriptional regulator with XRE-family HTH domain